MTIKDASIRRDFTFNALAYDPLENKIYDYFGGVKDLEDGIIRHTSSAFKEDSLRILRAFQFQARFNFKIHPDTIVEIREMLNTDDFDDLSKERIYEEWSKWGIKGIRHDLIFKFMRDTNLIERYPALNALKETPQDHVYHPEGDVEIHTTMTLHEMDKIIERENISGEEKLILVMSILLHDIGKPATTKEEMKKGRMTITSNGHEALGGEMSKEFLSKIGFHESLIAPISNIVANHLAGVSIHNIPSKSGKLKAVKKLSRRLYPATIKQLMYVIEADNRGRGGAYKEPTGMSDLAELSLEADIQNKPYESILKGRDLIAIGLKPSPKFGEIIRASFEAQESGEFSDIEGAKKWLNENVKKFIPESNLGEGLGLLYGGLVDGFNDDTFHIAKQMQSNGFSPKSIWEKTMWYFNEKDKKWRNEISDEGYRFKISIDQIYSDYLILKKRIFLSDLIEHELLFEMMPEAKKIIVIFKEYKDDDNFGGYDYGLNEITLFINYKYYKKHGKEYKSLHKKFGKEETLIAEVQHYLQGRFRYAKDIGYQKARERAQKGIKEERLRLESAISKGDLSSAKLIEEDIRDLEDDFENQVEFEYITQLGEIESRDVIYRMDFDIGERKKDFPLSIALDEHSVNLNDTKVFLAKGGVSGDGTIAPVIDADVTGRGGLVVGDSHADGGVPFVLEDSGTHIEEEGEEANIPNEIKDITKVYTMTGKNHEVIHKILQLVGLKLSNKVTSVRSGDLVICKASLWDDTVRTYTGTPIQIVSAVNESEGCNHIESGATMIENGKKKKMRRGGDIGYDDVVKILYSSGAPMMANGGRIPSKPAYLMTLDEYQKEVTPILKEYNKFVRKNDEYFSKVGYNGIFVYTFPEVLSDFKAGKVRGEHFRRGAYDKGFSDEKVIRKNWSYRKTRNFDENFKPAETPKGLAEKKNEYIEKLSKYFSDEEINVRIEGDETKSNKRAVRRAIENDTYKNLLKSGSVTTEELQKVATSVGVNLPKKIFDPLAVRAQENKAKYDKVYALMPKINLEVLTKLVSDIKESFKPLEKAIYELETKRFHGSILGMVKKGEANASVLSSWMPFFRDIFDVEKEEERKHKYIDDKSGREKEGVTSWIIGLSLKKDWKEVVSKYVLAEIEELRVSMIYSIISNFQKITLPIKNIKQVKLDVGDKGFEGSYKFTFENGSSFIFKTEAIGAGGYNIQKFHFRYLTHFTDIILADGTKASNRIGIVENFSVKDTTEHVNPYESIELAESIVEIADIVYDCIQSGGTQFRSPKDLKKDMGNKFKTVSVSFNPNEFGKIPHLQLDLIASAPIEDSQIKAIKFLRMIGGKKYNAKKMANGGVTETMSIKELLKHLYKEHHDSFAIAKDLEETTPLTGEMNAERVIEMWDKELDDHFKEEEERIFPRLVSMNITLVPDVDYLIATHNKFRNDIIPKVRSDRDRASVIRFASAIKEHILDEEKLFRSIMPDPYREITPEEMAKGGEAGDDMYDKISKMNKLELVKFMMDIDPLRPVFTKRFTTKELRAQAKSLYEKKQSKKKSNSSLLAPNGKKSNLTPEQYKLVRASAFKKWFGDWENDPKNASKVVDENGEPKVVYHGSRIAGFNVFKTDDFQPRNVRGMEWWEFGAFFTDDKKTAGIYSSMYGGGGVREFFLDIKNPIERGYDWDKRNWADIIPQIFIGGYEKSSNDGFIARGVEEQEIHQTTYNVKRPEQIKLADGTNTDFDPNNPDIRYEKGGVSDDFGGSGKSRKFVLTNKEIQNVISGKSEVRNGAVIQAASSYLSGSAGASSETKGSKLFKEQEAERVRLYATENNLWISVSHFKNYLSEGAEQKVYLTDGKNVIKVNDTIFYNSWEDYFNSLLLHNYFFPDTSYELIGITEHNGALCSVVRQPFVVETEKTDLGVVKKFMTDNGFVNTKNNDYRNYELGIILEDLHDENVLTKNGILYFVDTVFYIKENSGIRYEKGAEVNESNYFQNTQGEFEIINKDEYDAVDVEEFVSDFGSRYKTKDGMLYRGADHWGVFGTVIWSLKNKEYAGDSFEGELDAGLDGYDKLIYGKIPFSSMSPHKRAVAHEDGLVRVWVSMTADSPPRAGITPYIEVHPSLSIDDVKNVVSGKYPDYAYFKYKGTRHA